MFLFKASLENFNGLVLLNSATANNLIVLILKSSKDSFEVDENSWFYAKYMFLLQLKSNAS
tara:strand:+ start:2453 stop:2635 length:183 start_codon:yes stop_codon:yes gene_type:complete